MLSFVDAVRADVERQREEEDGPDDPPERLGHHREPVLATLVDDLLARGRGGCSRSSSAALTLRARRIRSGAGMCASVDLAQTLTGEVGIELGGADASMAQQGLNGAQIGSALEQMRREAVPERVRRHVAR